MIKKEWSTIKRSDVHVWFSELPTNNLLRHLNGRKRKPEIKTIWLIFLSFFFLSEPMNRENKTKPLRFVFRKQSNNAKCTPHDTYTLRTIFRCNWYSSQKTFPFSAFLMMVMIILKFIRRILKIITFRAQQTKKLWMRINIFSVSFFIAYGWTLNIQD